MKQETIEYFRRRQRDEREAVANASCEQGRWAHQELADAYARLVVIEELKTSGAIPSGKVISFAEALRARDDAEYGRGRARTSGFGDPAVRRG